jgi:hypothetical protein
MELAGFKKVKITDIITAVQFDYFVTSIGKRQQFLSCLQGSRSQHYRRLTLPAEDSPVRLQAERYER